MLADRLVHRYINKQMGDRSSSTSQPESQSTGKGSCLGLVRSLVGRVVGFLRSIDRCLVRSPVVLLLLLWVRALLRLASNCISFCLVVDDVGKMLQERGREFGTTTGRPRRCGWLDVCMLRFSRLVSGFCAINLTKLDVLTGIPILKVATAYRNKDTGA